MIRVTHSANIYLRALQQSALDTTRPSRTLILHRPDILPFERAEARVEVEFLNSLPDSQNGIGTHRDPIRDAPHEGEADHTLFARNRIDSARCSEDGVSDEELLLPMQEEGTVEMAAGQDCRDTCGKERRVNDDSGNDTKSVGAVTPTHRQSRPEVYACTSRSTIADQRLQRLVAGSSPYPARQRRQDSRMCGTSPPLHA